MTQPGRVKEQGMLLLLLERTRALQHLLHVATDLGIQNATAVPQRLRCRLL